jgi:hypothetical protein
MHWTCNYQNHLIFDDTNYSSKRGKIAFNEAINSCCDFERWNVSEEYEWVVD